MNDLRNIVSYFCTLLYRLDLGVYIEIVSNDIVVKCAV